MWSVGRVYVRWSAELSLAQTSKPSLEVAYRLLHHKERHKHPKYVTQSRATRCITANVLQANKVDAQCDKLATELS